jgi:hypothetical protein
VAVGVVGELPPAAAHPERLRLDALAAGADRGDVGVVADAEQVRAGGLPAADGGEAEGLAGAAPSAATGSGEEGMAGREIEKPSRDRSCSSI